MADTAAARRRDELAQLRTRAGDHGDHPAHDIEHLEVEEIRIKHIMEDTGADVDHRTQRGGAEMCFRYFMLVPKPSAEYKGRALRAMSPSAWLSKPMLLVPMYLGSGGAPRAAPVKLPGGGFEVGVPRDFVKAHPRLVKLSMLVVKVGIKAGAAALGVHIPCSALGMLDKVALSLLSETMLLADTLTRDIATPAGGAIGRVQGELQEPERAVDELATDATYRSLSRGEYVQLRAWMDREHGAGWQGKVGLVKRVDGQSGRIEWVPEDAGDRV